MGFIEQIAPIIQKYAPQYGIKVCSPIIAQAILESASGTSELAINAHNYFGLKYRANRCPSACGVYYKVGSEQNKDGSYTSSAMQWMKFVNMDNGVKGYFDFINIPNYSNLKSVTSPEAYLKNIKSAGYATSLNYVQNLMNVINKYNLTKYDPQTDVTNPVNMSIHTLLANPANYGGTRNASSIKYLIYHYTANKTDKAKSNANYFKNNIVKASAHYFVDKNDIYQSVEDLRVAYSVGGAKWSDCNSTGGGSMYGRITNTNSISIEMCSTNGIISEATIQNAVKLGKEIVKKYNIPISNVYRHFDVNGKHCPGWNGWYGNNSSKWTDLKKRLSGTTNNVVSDSSHPTNSNTKSLYRVRKSWSDSSSQIGAYSSLNNAKAACKNGYFVFDNNGNIVYPVQPNSSTTNSKTYTVVKGDTLAKIGQKTGIVWEKIAELNNIKSPYLIKVGQVLKLSNNPTSNQNDSTSSSKYVKNGTDYSLVFNPTFYSNKYPDLKKAFGINATALFNHFINYGMKEGRQAIETFNVSAYKNNYADLRNAFGNNMPEYYKHYIKYGYKEKRKAI